MTHYEVLGVGPRASQSEIRAAYHRQARRHHPDFHAGAPASEQAAARRRMQEVNEAWRVLGHPGRRAAYDRSLERPPGPTPGSHGPADAWGLDPDEAAAAAEARWAERDRWAPDPVPGRRRPLLLAPVLLLACSIVAGVCWVTTGLAALLALSAVTGVGAVALFVVAPLVVMVGARHDE